MIETLPVVSPYSQGLDTSSFSLEQLFPEVDCELEPFGHRVIVQVRRVVNTTKSGIILAEETKQNEAYNTQVARLVRVGPLAFKKRDTSEPWPEGVWAAPGQFVKVSRWGGDQWSVDPKDGGNPVIFRMVGDHELLGRFTGDPLSVKAYIS